MRLLVVEDDPDLNRQLATALTDAGYVVDRAFDGEEGHLSRRQRALRRRRARHRPAQDGRHLGPRGPGAATGVRCRS